jgi:hypothetical protein
VAGIVRRSFNQAEKAADPALKAQLAELHAAVVEMCKHLKTEPEQKDAAEALETLTKEATREQPRQKWYEVSAEGLISAATAVGEVGTKVVGLVKGIAGLLGLVV